MEKTTDGIYIGQESELVRLFENWVRYVEVKTDFEVHEMRPRGSRTGKICYLVAGKYDFSPTRDSWFRACFMDASQFIFKVKRFVFAPEMSFLTSRGKRSCFVSKGRRSIELSLLFIYFLPISLSCRFSIAKTNLLNISLFCISISDVDSVFFHCGLKTVKQQQRMMNGGWSSRWVICDYNLIISKWFYFIVSYIFLSTVQA